jgi:hypothetical protein
MQPLDALREEDVGGQHEGPRASAPGRNRLLAERAEEQLSTRVTVGEEESDYLRAAEVVQPRVDLRLLPPAVRVKMLCCQN